MRRMIIIVVSSVCQRIYSMIFIVISLIGERAVVAISVRVSRALIRLC